jgi:hypothetical protein
MLHMVPWTNRPEKIKTGVRTGRTNTMCGWGRRVSFGTTNKYIKVANAHKTVENAHKTIENGQER